MIFSSVLFLFLFLPATLGVSYLFDAVARRARRPAGWIEAVNVWLIAASVVFYGWSEARLLWLLLAGGARPMDQVAAG